MYRRNNVAIFSTSPHTTSIELLKTLYKIHCAEFACWLCILYIQAVDTFGCCCMLHYRENLKINANVSNLNFSLSKTALTQGTD